MKHGNGIMIYKSGDSYDGQWADNKRNGKGRMIWKNRDEEYSGEWKVILLIDFLEWRASWLWHLCLGLKGT
jgi:hypothetical protein